MPNRPVKSLAVSEYFLNRNHFPKDAEFNSLIKQVEKAIDKGVFPKMITQGSSGSYFAKNLEEETVGVFKPKNEEPYGPRNPKWTKWFQRVCSPCCFGRGCLLLNQGYLSEAGASLVDEKLGLNIVPKTKVVYLAAPTFNYSELDRSTADSKSKIAQVLPKIGKKFHRIGLPPKVGSFQTFVSGYKDATTFFKEFDMDNASFEIKRNFKLQFERLVVIDYIIRNTDRGSDNWLIKIEEETLPELAPAGISTKSTKCSMKTAKEFTPLDSTANLIQTSLVKIVAIDNGLAFPFKHPDEWRFYPFGWQYLPVAKEPFSEELCDYMLSHLKNVLFVEDLCDELTKLFMLDPEFSESKCAMQMSVMRGQILNLCQIMEEKKSPFDLTNKTPQIVSPPAGSKKLKARWSWYEKSEAKTSPFFKSI